MGSVLSTFKARSVKKLAGSTKLLGKIRRGAARRLAQGDAWVKHTPANRAAVSAFNNSRRTTVITEYDHEKKRHVVVRTIHKGPAK